MRNRTLFRTLVAATVVAVAFGAVWCRPAFAQINWNGTTNTSFLEGSNWSGGNVPGSGSGEVRFGRNAPTNPASVYSGSSSVVDLMVFGWNNYNGLSLTVNSGTLGTGGINMGWTDGDGTATGTASLTINGGRLYTQQVNGGGNFDSNLTVGTKTKFVMTGGQFDVNGSNGNRTLRFASRDDFGADAPGTVTYLTITGGTITSNTRIIFGRGNNNVATNQNARVTGTMSGGLMVAQGSGGNGTLEFGGGKLLLTSGTIRGNDISWRDGFNRQVQTGSGSGIYVNQDAGVFMQGGVIQVVNGAKESSVVTYPIGSDPTNFTAVYSAYRGQGRSLLGGSSGIASLIDTTTGTWSTFQKLQSGLADHAIRVLMTTFSSTPMSNTFASIKGDYNLDGQVNYADYNQWQTENGNAYADSNTSTYSKVAYWGADGNGDAQVDAADVTVWQSQLGQRTVGGPYTAAADVDFNVASGSQSQGSALTFLDTKNVSKTGAGTVVFDGANTFTGTTTVSAGTLQVSNSAALTSSVVRVQSGAALKVDSGFAMQASSVTLNGGTLDGAGATLVVDPFVGIGSLEIMAGNVTGSPNLSVGGSGPVKGQVTLSSNTPLVVNVSSLSVDAATGGKVDLGLGRINIASGNAIDLLADLLSGRAGGSWNGTGGITSSAAAASGGTRTVGWIDNSGSLSVAFAAPGDTNLDWTVDVNDAANLLTAGKYDTGLAATWNEGDFNYDGVVDIQDAAEFTTTGLFNAGVYNPPSVSGAVAAVPEPSSAGIAFGMAGLMLAWRLRRRAA